MGQYSKSIYSQLQDALGEISVLKKENKRQEKLIKDQVAQIILLTKLLEEQNTKLTEEIERLRKQINADSSNSSLPPSQDQKPNTKIFNSREKRGNPSGGQFGHKGFWLSKVDIEKKIASGLMRHEIIEHGQGCSYISKYVIETKTETIAIEHRFYADESGRISIPTEFRPDVQYGNDLKTFATMLVGRGIVASNRIVEFVANLSNENIQLSDGSIYNWLAEFNTKAQPEINKITTNLLNSPLMHDDETSIRCENKNMFFRNYSTENQVRYTLNPTKGKQSIEDDGILPKFTGTLIHDHNTVNYNYGTRHGECNVHLIRYLKRNFEDTRNEWSNDLISFLTSVNTTKKLAINYELESFEKIDLERYQKKYDEILAVGFAANKNTKSGHFKKEELKLLRRLQKYRTNHLLFLQDFTVPFDNNLSERDLRMLKTKAKVSGCFRSLSGGRIFANLMSIIKTATKQSRSPYHAVRQIFNCS